MSNWWDYFTKNYDNFLKYFRVLLSVKISLFRKMNSYSRKDQFHKMSTKLYTSKNCVQPQLG